MATLSFTTITLGVAVLIGGLYTGLAGVLVGADMLLSKLMLWVGLGKMVFLLQAVKKIPMLVIKKKCMSFVDILFCGNICKNNAKSQLAFRYLVFTYGETTIVALDFKTHRVYHSKLG